MRALIGVVGLLVALAVVAMLAMKQLRSPGVVATPVLPAASAPAATVREQVVQTQQQIKADVGAALQQGADRRASEIEK